MSESTRKAETLSLDLWHHRELWENEAHRAELADEDDRSQEAAEVEGFYRRASDTIDDLVGRIQELERELDELERERDDLRYEAEARES